MERREALQKVALLLGGTVLGASAFLSGCANPDSGLGEGVNFTTNDIAFLDEVAETIIPTTNTPGAKAAKTGEFMARMVKDCYEAKDQKIFREGMGNIDKASKKKFDKAFMSITPEQRTQLLNEIHQEMRDVTAKADRERKEDENRQKAAEEKEEQKQNSNQESEKTSLEKQQDKSKSRDKHYFRMMKELTLLGYFTSEIGQTQALRFNMVPGRYEGCVPYKKGEKAWA